MTMDSQDEERLLAEIKKAVSQGKKSFTFTDKEGKTVTINLEKPNEQGICSPYDSF